MRQHPRGKNKNTKESEKPEASSRVNEKPKTPPNYLSEKPDIGRDDPPPPSISLPSRQPELCAAGWSRYHIRSDQPQHKPSANPPLNPPPAGRFVVRAALTRFHRALASSLSSLLSPFASRRLLALSSTLLHLMFTTPE